MDYLQEDVHSEWVTCVRFSNHSTNPILVSCSTDRVVKVHDYGRNAIAIMDVL